MTEPLRTSGLAWVRALVDPRIVSGWSLPEWERAIRLARRHRLLARLAAGVDAAGLAAGVPAPASRHLLAARRLSEARTQAMLWLIECLPDMLDRPRFPLVLLKGAAYVGQDLGIATGRLPSDLDILVPKQDIAEVQFRLTQAGWREPQLDAHDRRYYLEWSHELPPLQHPRHALELDVHHNILPPRGGRWIDTGPLLANLAPSRWPQWQVLSPADQVLHSAAHLFFDAEPRDRIRDLVDLDGLFRHFGPVPGFWDDLPRRAMALGLEEPLVLACHFTRAWLGSPIPEPLLHALAARHGHGLSLRLLKPVLGALLMPGEPGDADSTLKRLAGTAVLARYHWHRLPLRLLLPHLWRKWRLARAASPKQDAA